MPYLCSTSDDEINDATHDETLAYKMTLNVYLKRGIDMILE